MISSMTRRKSSTESNSSFYEGNEVCRQGHLRKSPPSNLFNSQSSWKKRLFLLTKSKQGNYALHYYRNQNSERRGLIEINQISHIQQGIIDEKKRAAVCKMFQCQPDAVISISTAVRDYFLVGKEIKDIEGWLEAIHSAWEETKPKEKEASEQIRAPGARDEGIGTSACNSPVFSSGAKRNTSANSDTSFIRERMRPYSDPFLNILPHLDVLEENRRRPDSDPLPSLPEIHRVPETETGYIQTLEKTDSQEEMKRDSVYDVPRKWLISANTEPVECDEVPESGNETQESDNDENTQSHYVTMDEIVYYNDLRNSLRDVKSKTGSAESLSTDEEYNQKLSCRDNSQSASPRSRRSPSNHSWVSDEPKGDKKPDGLSDFQLKILLSEHTGQLEKWNIDLPKDDIKKYLTLAEIGNRVCVSNWQGASDVFNHGDQITSVNDLAVQCKAAVFEDIDRAFKKNVILSILRIPNSKVFCNGEGLCSRPH